MVTAYLSLFPTKRVYLGTSEITDNFFLNKQKHTDYYNQIEVLLFKDISLNNLTFCWCEQIHSNKVKVILKTDGGPENGEIKGYDGIVTNQKEVVLCVKHADCFPVYLYDPVNEAIGLVHSGWRGTKDKIALKALEEMEHAFGTLPKNVLVGIGPGARNCCYCFDKNVDPVQVRLPEWQPYITDMGTKWCIDLPGFIKGSLIAAGVQAAHIEDYKDCTICTGTYHSWSNQKKKGEKLKNGISFMVMR